MTTVSLITEEQASEQVKIIYQDIKKVFGIPFVPNLFKAMANNPQQLEATWDGTVNLFSKTNKNHFS